MFLAIWLVPFVHSFRSVSQANYGAQIADIQAQLSSSGPAMACTSPTGCSDQFRNLGWLWSLPSDSSDSRGLGQSITWAWDPALCDKLMPIFRERFTTISFIDCSWIKAGMHRAFATWSQNHPLISFTEVTTACEEAGLMTSGAQLGSPGCSLAEIWITYKSDSSASSDAVGKAYATAQPSTTFKYTNYQQTGEEMMEVSSPTTARVSCPMAPVAPPAHSVD